MHPSILFINTTSSKSPYVYPIGLDYLISYLRENGIKNISILDLSIINPILWKKSLIEKLLKKSYLLIGFSLRNLTDQIYGGKNYLPEIRNLITLAKKILKKQNTNTKIIIGGSGFSISPDTLLKYLGADYGIIGQGEKVTLKLIKSIENNIYPQKTLLNENIDIRNIYYRRGVWGEIDEYIKLGCSGNIQTKRGCNKKCIYCSYPIIEGKNILLRDPKIVAKEFQKLEKLGFNKINIVDATFNNPKKHAKEVLKSFVEAKTKTEWTAFFNPKDIDEELLKLVKATKGGNPLKFTIESGSDKILNNLKKGYTKKDIEKAVFLCRKINIPFSFTVLFGSPKENEKTIAETCKLIVESKPVYVSISVGIFIYKGTLLAKTTKNIVWKKEEELLGNTFYPVNFKKIKTLVGNILSQGKINYFFSDQKL